MYKLRKFYPPGFNPQQYWADRYAQEHIAGRSSDEFRRQDFWPLMKQHLPRDKKILDAGCGVGGWIIFLKEEGFDVEGIDSAARTVRAMTEYDPEIKVKIADVDAIPYPDNLFGGVVAVGALEYVEDRVDEALREVNRVLGPEGVFLLEVPITNLLRRVFYIPLKELERRIKGWQGNEPVFANYFFDRHELVRKLKATGFSIITEQPHELPDSNSHYGLYVDWKWLRGSEPYHLNFLGLAIKKLANLISPWIASTGMVIVAKKR